MKKRAFLNCLCFLLLVVVSAGQAGPIQVATAPSGSHVYRASIAPRPESKSASVSAKTEQVQAPAKAPAKAESAPAPAAKEVKSQPAKSVKKTKAAATSKKSRSASSSKKAKAKASSTAKAKPASVKTASKSAAPVKKSAKHVVRRTVSAPSPATAQAVETPRAAEPAPETPKAETVMPDVQETRDVAAVEPDSGTRVRPAAGDDETASAKDLFLNVKSAILINMTTGQVYYEHNADRTIQPASITKLLTLYLIREAIAQGRISPNTPIPVSVQAVKTGGSRMRLKRGEKVPLSELIKGISVVSANNACVAVAEYMGGGDPSKFVAQMNDKARKFGMTSSRFRNPSGLPDRAQLSTARDIAKLSMNYLRTFPESLQIHSMTTHTYHGSTHRNANSLLKTYKGADGLKTGFVCEAGYNITATAKRGNTRLLAVVLGAQNSAVRQRETAKLLDFGFKRVERENGLGNRASGPSKKPKA